MRKVLKTYLRYPQVFANMAITANLDEGRRKGIIWYTLGAGKIALAYYNVKYLTDYHQKKQIIPSFILLMTDWIS
ncbi:hypothetical protein [Sphingobacterium cavernae]|uniref:hypothetical protein n=1 Tax=Sphingobacterium cavernae TaxID=2592657 RepID=UPI00122FBDA6|nr:hypothetical protein [Sphingobacterium cavernae]